MANANCAQLVVVNGVANVDADWQRQMVFVFEVGVDEPLARRPVLRNRGDLGQAFETTIRGGTSAGRLGTGS